MNILITICARGGSKGIKDKNIKELAGRPLIAYTIEIAKKWQRADVICSTDSEKIAEVAKRFGAEIPFIRPNELATDESGKIPVIRHALIECERIYRKKYDFVVDLDVTSPLRTMQDLDTCLEIFGNKNAEVLFSVVKSRKSPYFNMVELNKEGYAELSKKPGNLVLRRQDAPNVYEINGSIYFYKREFLLNPNNMHPVDSNKVAVYVMGGSYAIDIDNEIDFKFIEFLISNKVVKYN